MSILLRPYQTQIVDDTREALRRNQGVLINLATGGGKTQIAAFIAKGVSDRGKKIWFAAHRAELLSQTALTFDRAEIDYGFIAAKRRPQPYAPVQICSIQTLVNRLDRYSAPHILFVDEAKRSVAPTYEKIIRHCLEAGTRIIGLDATPWRINGAGFREYPSVAGAPATEEREARPALPTVSLYGEMVKGPAPSWLIANGWLSRYRAFTPSTPDMTGAHTVAGDYDTHDLEEIMDKPSVTGDIIKHWQNIARGKRTILFDVSVESSRHQVEAFAAAGIRALHIDGDTDDDVRRSAAVQLATGQIDVLCNVDLLSDGYDLAAAAGMDVSIEAGIFKRPTQSLALWFQQIGRVMRPKPEPAILLDHAGNIIRMRRMFGAGLPDHDYNWSLDPWDRKAAKKKRDAETKVDIRQCGQCYHVHSPAPACPSCGYVYPKNGRQVEQRDGDLQEIDQALLQREKELAAQFRKREELACRSYEDFKALGERRGYAPKWASLRWRDSAARRRQKEAAE